MKPCGKPIKTYESTRISDILRCLFFFKNKNIKIIWKQRIFHST